MREGGRASEKKMVADLGFPRARRRGQEGAFRPQAVHIKELDRQPLVIGGVENIGRRQPEAVLVVVVGEGVAVGGLEVFARKLRRWRPNSLLTRP